MLHGVSKLTFSNDRNVGQPESNMRSSQYNGSMKKVTDSSNYKQDA